MTIDRAIEILDPEHREHYDGMDEVNEACRMGMEALERTRWIPCSERVPEDEEAPQGIVKICPQCGKEFTQGKIKQKIYCSFECQKAHAQSAAYRRYHDRKAAADEG